MGSTGHGLAALEAEAAGQQDGAADQLGAQTQSAGAGQHSQHLGFRIVGLAFMANSSSASILVNTSLLWTWVHGKLLEEPVRQA